MFNAEREVRRLGRIRCSFALFLKIGERIFRKLEIFEILRAVEGDTLWFLHLVSSFAL